jgi:hypothetical protein
MRLGGGRLARYRQLGVVEVDSDILKPGNSNVAVTVLESLDSSRLSLKREDRRVKERNKVNE